jgi:transposase-like protein
VYVDVKHLPKLRTANGESRKRYLYVAIDRASRFVHLAVKDDETTTSAVAFLKEAVRAFPFEVTHGRSDSAGRASHARRHAKASTRIPRPHPPAL